MGCVTKGEAPFHTGMTVIRLTVLIGHHANDFGALHLSAEGTTDTAVGTGRHHAVLGLTALDDRLLAQGGGRTGLHAGAAGHAIGIEKGLLGPRAHMGVEPAPGDGQGKRALHFIASTHTARADDAFARIESEVRIALVFLGHAVILACVAVTHFAQTHRARHVLQLTVTVGRTGQTVERMIGDVEFHDVAP